MKYNFEFINHKQITTKFLWNDGIHLLDTGKSVLGQNFVNKVSNFFRKNNFHFRQILRTKPNNLVQGKQLYFDYFEQL